MAIYGYNEDGLKRQNTKRSALNDGDLRNFKRLKQQDQEQQGTFDHKHFQAAFISWVVTDDISMRRAASERHKSLLIYRNSFIEAAVPQSHNTVANWILRTFVKIKPKVAASLACAKSSITISFDGWKSGTEVDYLGVMAHWIDSNCKARVALLALRNTFGSKSGEEQKHHLLEVLREYKITSKIGFFISDSASNNDKALELLAKHIDLDPAQQRLRCAAHVVNLVCKAILYGVDTDCISEVCRTADNPDENDDLSTPSVTQFEQILRTKDRQAILRAWRKKGPLGKLHNIVSHARATPARRHFFISKQREVAVDEGPRLFELVINGGIRWNSAHDMLERAFKLKDAIDLYQSHHRQTAEDPLDDDVLTADDWQELSLLRQLLAPMKKMSLLLQSDFGQSAHGSLYQSLQAVDWLMTKLEDYKRQQQYQPYSHFKACINLGWKKLDKYYRLSDSTSAYRAAILVHPHCKMGWFDKHWGSSHPEWISAAKKAVQESFYGYERRFSDEVAAASSSSPPHSEMDEFEQYNLISDDSAMLNDFERYLREPIEPNHKVDPLQWWQANEHRFPIL